MEYKIGKKVQHIGTGDYLWILREGKEQILCRTKDLREVWLYPWELKEVDSLEESKGSNRFL